MRGLLSLFVFSLVTLSAADMTKIQVAVTNQNGKPVENASVIVKFVEGRSKAKLGAKIHTQWEMKTNQDGFAKIPEIPQGKILVQVIASNYQTFGQNFDVNEEEKTIEVKLNPPQPQYTAHPK